MLLAWSVIRSAINRMPLSIVLASGSSKVERFILAAIHSLGRFGPVTKDCIGGQRILGAKQPEATSGSVLLWDLAQAIFVSFSRPRSLAFRQANMNPAVTSGDGTGPSTA